MSISNIVHKNRDAIQFEWQDPQQPVIHALQRIMISDVPTLAIDMVMVDENTSILADPELSLRLGKIFDFSFVV
jgi:DNA-directed RNA polymerase II subunit RPB3